MSKVKKATANMTDTQAMRLGDDVAKWFASKKGKLALESVLKKGTPLSDSVRKAREIDPDTLREPVGI